MYSDKVLFKKGLVMSNQNNCFIRWFEDIGINDTALVGGKTSSLGEMYSALAKKGVRVPNGFAITANAYTHMIEQAGIMPALKELLCGIDKTSIKDLSSRGKAIRSLIYDAPLPEELVQDIATAYQEMENLYGKDIDVAVRSSATAEDLPSASFAGQHESYLNISGLPHLLEACKSCFASLFTDRAISYRIDNGFDHFKVALSIAIQQMVRADMAASGVMFTLDSESGFRDIVLINGTYGLGENIVQGTIEPDEFYVHKPTLELGYRAVLRRTLGAKQMTMIYETGRSRQTVRNLPTVRAARRQFCISDEEVLKLADYAVIIEEHYSALAQHNVPMDIEWAKDGRTGELFIIQARPETVVSQRKPNIFKRYHLIGTSETLASGRAVGEKIATGQVRHVNSATGLEYVEDGEILVTNTTSPDWEPVMERVSAILTNTGGRTCHAAIVARELGIPAIVGMGDITERLSDGQLVTVSCAEGEIGKVYEGSVAFESEEIDVSNSQRPDTKIMVNLGNPDSAFRTSFLPSDGVGLARLEFIISEYIKAHPMALLYPERVTDPKQSVAIEELTKSHPDGRAYFIEKLSEGIGTIAAAFYPKPVVVRLSDFKTNEYANLLGGEFFEPKEANPMIGFRGASRYTHPAYEEGFALECAAVKRVRDDMGLTNVIVMVPFCRRVEEGEAVLAAMANYGLRRGDNGLKIYVMCEIPNNVIQIDAFAEIFDGFSIGSNDLTQLVLGVDRDSEIVAFDFDELDPGVLEMVRRAIEGAHRNNKPCGICGQAPSDFPEFTEFLVKHGIDSISLTPDTVIGTTQAVNNIEQMMPQKERNRA